MKYRNLLAQQIAVLQQGLIERDAAAKATLLALLSGENALLIGPPGTAKSLLARRAAACFGEPFFEYLLTRFTTPDEIFGPLSLSALKSDRYERQTEGYLPTAKTAFLDEIFKANSSILNALLSLLNERIFHNGAQRLTTPLVGIIAASNEIPIDQPELAALYDRFLVRLYIDDVSDANWHRLLDLPAQEASIPPLPPHFVEQLRISANAVRIPAVIADALHKLWRALRSALREDARERLSDRRLVKVLRLLRCAAAANDRSEVDLSDLLLLKDCVWNHPDNAGKVRELIEEVIAEQSRLLASQTPRKKDQRAEKGENTGDAQPPGTAKPSPRDLAKIADARRGAKIKGYAGSGTAEDPLLIADMDDLTGLMRPEIGQQGLHCQLVADIDASAVTTWPEINFKGVFDGNGLTINLPGNNTLFASLTDAQARALRITNGGLARNAQKTHFRACTSTGILVRNSVGCRFHACESQSSLVDTARDSSFEACRANVCIVISRAENCTISRCQAVYPIVWDTAKNCQITDSLALLSCDLVSADLDPLSAVLATVLGHSMPKLLSCDRFEYSGFECRGGIASNLSEGTRVSNCLVTGQWKGKNNVKIGGIAWKCVNSRIEGCAIGPLAFEGGCRLDSVIAQYENNGVGESNVVIDSVTSGNSKDYRPIAAAIFTQRFFEEHLGWDFSTVWRWDDQNQRPALRAVGLAASNESERRRRAQELDDAARGLLTDLLSRNLWL